MRYFRSIAAGVAAMFIGVVSANAATLLYSFETGDSPNSVDGFANNGGTAVSQDTIGHTDGSNSMKNVTASGAFFAGALTGSTPAALDDPATKSISFDYTVAPGDTYAGAFADIGITIFGAIPDGMGGLIFGQQFQVDASEEQNAALAPGTYSLVVPLIGTDPISFEASQPLSEVLADGFIPTGFEFFYSKSTDAPLTDYIDNVQAQVPEPASLGVGAVGGLLMLARRRRKV
jgi:hypothetical protein